MSQKIKVGGIGKHSVTNLLFTHMNIMFIESKELIIANLIIAALTVLT